MVIRKLEKKEHNAARELYEEVFPEDSKEFVDYYYSEKTKDNIIYMIEEDGQIQSMLHLNPYQIMVNGQKKLLHYIVAVATRQSYRRRGYMGGLLRAALTDMYQEGEIFTYLMPAAESIYLPYDFRTVYEQDRQFYQENEDTAPGIEIAELKGEECKELAVFANQYLSEHYQIYADRSEYYYRRLMKEYAADGGKLMIYRENGQLRDLRLFVPEMEEEKPKIMVRIVDVRKMLSNVKLTSLIGMCFQITDSIIKENNRCVVITGTEHSGVMLMDGKGSNREGTIPIAALGSFLFGAISAEELSMEDGVEMTERMKEELKKIIPLSSIYLNETV